MKDPFEEFYTLTICEPWFPENPSNGIPSKFLSPSQVFWKFKEERSETKTLPKVKLNAFPCQLRNTHLSTFEELYPNTEW